MMIQGQLFPETYAKINAKNRLLKNIEFSRTYYGPTFTNPSTFFLSWNWYSKIILILFLPFQHICHILMLKNVYDFHRSPRTEGAFDECYQNHQTLIPFFSPGSYCKDARWLLYSPECKYQRLVLVILLGARIWIP
jgi:hypothetical protein